jgi:hypothetical protein
MKYTQELIKKILKQRGLSEIEHQLNFLEDIQLKVYEKPYVLGAGPSSGKTEMCLLWLEGFYSIKENIKKRTLIIPASKVILRDNFEERLKYFNPSFKYFVITSDITKEEFKRIIEDEQYQVIVCLPHALNSNIESLVKFDNFVLDEAHEWYFAKSKTPKDTGYKRGVVFNVLKKIDPDIQLLLTGTPSKFIAEKEKFNFFFVTGMELFDAGLITNVQIEIVSSHLDFSTGSYQSPFGNLRGSIKHSKKDSKKSLEEVCLQMIKKLNNPNKGFLGSLGHTLNNSVLDNSIGSIGKMFCILEKTMIICHRQDQANEFYSVLNSFKELKGRVLTSHSDNDPDNSNFDLFQNNQEIKVLIVVNRGRLGFNMRELFNIVDFSYSKNLDLLYQMIARLFRKSSNHPSKKKIFYKVSPAKTSIFFQDIMTAVLCLMKAEWYTRFNGKNMGEIEIPRPRRVRSSNDTQEVVEKKSTKQKFTPISWEDLEIPLNLNLFKSYPLYSAKDSFSTISMTTLDKCRDEFYKMDKIYYGVDPTDENEVRNFIKDNQIHSRSEIAWMRRSNFHKTISENGILDSIFPQKNTVVDYNNLTEIKKFMDTNNIIDRKDLKSRFFGLYKSLSNRGIIGDFLKPKFKASVSLKDDYDLDVNDELQVTKFIKKQKIKTKQELADFANQALYNALRRNGMLYKIFPEGRTRNVKAEAFEKEITNFYNKNKDKSARKICVLLGYDPNVKSKTASKIIKKLKSK